MSNEPLKKTPVHDCHLKLNARMVPFAGYEMPVQYQGVLEETKRVRQTAGLFDVSHMGQFTIRGKGALEALQKLVTNNLSRLSLGQAQYNIMCNEAGGAIDDLVVYYRGEDYVYLCVNASNREKDFNWISAHIGKDYTITDESDDTALLALQGPQAQAVLAKGADKATLTNLKYYWATEAKVFDTPVYLSRTGYTGEDGFELYVRKELAPHLWTHIMDFGREHDVTAAGLGARDTLRLEMGYALYGHELNIDISPLCAKLGWVVKLDQPASFIGKEALIEEKQTGSSRTLKPFVVKDRRIARQGYSILNSDNQIIGEICSGGFSPHREAPIALGFVKSEFASLDKYYAQIRNQAIEMESVKLPFVQPHTKK